MDNKLNVDTVRLAYKLILGREPENEAAVQSHMLLGSIEKIRDVMMSSQEFRSIIPQSGFASSKWVAVDVLDRFIMWIDLHDRYVSQGCLNNSWEPEETAFFVSRLRSGDIVFDIGANVGWFSLVAAKHVGSTGKVHAFEPRPETAQMLKRTIAMNGLRSIVQVWEFALSDQADEIRLQWESDTNNPGHSFLASKGKRHDTLAAHDSAKVISCRLDDVLPEVAPDIIKIDIEGAEPLALAGAKSAILRKKPVILSEIFPDQLRKVAGVTTAQFIEQLEAYGYGCYLLEDGKPTRRIKDFPSDVKKELVSVVFEWRGGM